ncbi:MAG TPA: hypothetical protein GX004_06570 [Firmicutes bacterium]|jgi:hypothetical protein|nr:hypothetical protein [Bacillota bacterium]
MINKEDKTFDGKASPKTPDAAGAEASTNQATVFPIGVMLFDCGNCCKEAIGYGFTQLIVGEAEIDFRAEDIITRAYQGGRLVETQFSHTAITIPRERFCYRARTVRDLNPCTPLNIGVSPLTFEIDCGACCTQFLNVETTDTPVPGFLLISPPEGQLIYIKTFSNGKLVSLRATDFEVNIAESRICIRKQDVIVVDPQLKYTCGCARSVSCSPFCDCNPCHR